MSEKQMAMKKLQQADFVLLETGLYLNGYPTCREALQYYDEAKKAAKAARCAYEESYGPLKLISAGGENCWNWTVAPLPWELEAN